MSQLPPVDAPPALPAAAAPPRLLAAGLIGLGIVAVLGFLGWQGMQRGLIGRGAPQSDTVVISIDGMSCVGCAGAVEATIREVDGVADVTVDYDRRRANVRLANPNVAPATLVAAVEDAGYKARIEPAER
jgi:copper chaperone CopZ